MTDDRSADDQSKKVDVVLSGGGVKFIGLVGAAVALMDAGFSIHRASGVSAGSVVAALLAAATKGDPLTSEEVKELALSVPLRKWRDAGPLPVVGPALGMFSGSALYRGDFAHQWVRSELKNLGVTTFGDLGFDDDLDFEERRYKLAVTVVDLTTSQLVRLPWDYQRVYGLDPDEQLVADAVRASMAIPFFYQPVKLTSATGLTSTLVDGGMLSNFPIDCFDRPDGKPPRWPTIGVTVIPTLTGGIHKMVPALRPLRSLGPPSLLEGLITTILVGRDQTYLNLPSVRARAIEVPTSDVGILDFNASRRSLEALYDKGYQAAQSFLSTWNWSAYRERFCLAAEAWALPPR